MVSWWIVLLNSSILVSLRNQWQILSLSALTSSIIDLEHFMAARSFLLKDAVSLSERPILHCTTIP